MREDLLPVTLEGKFAHLIQECAEVQIAITKLQIFGERPTDPKTGKQYDNIQTLYQELDDLQHAVSAVVKHLGPRPPDLSLTAGIQSSNSTEVTVHPVQNHHRPGQRSQVSTTVTTRAYEVYRHLFGEQKALITGGCRGGFSAGELIAFLYARSFPREEWRQRLDEAMRNMRIS